MKQVSYLRVGAEQPNQILITRLVLHMSTQSFCREVFECIYLAFCHAVVVLKIEFGLLLFTFFYVHEKKVLDSRKFSTSGFRWIYMF